MDISVIRVIRILKIQLLQHLIQVCFSPPASGDSQHVSYWHVVCANEAKIKVGCIGKDEAPPSLTHLYKPTPLAFVDPFTTL